MKNNKTNFQFEEQILDYSITDIVARCFERYAKYIILERALPDVRDGLKPVQRRILYAMYDLGLTSDKAYKKAARVVGEVIGKYHPHGDSAVYAAMCRMAQEWKVASPLIEMQGNKGSIDGDNPAAMRYTEARLSEIAQLLLNDIKKNTVIFTKNFDDSETEPVVLPGYFPNLLVNGAAGIAVGMATNIPPHNLGEVINALIIRINNPNVTCKEIMQTALKGPDFPTGGIIQGLKGIKEAYHTGKGRIVIRAKTAIQRQGKVYQIIISELPFEVIKQELIKKIDAVREAQTIHGIKEIRDETDRFGLRIVIDLASDVKVEEILNYLFKNTTLQIYYNFNLVAIANKKPVQMTLLEMLDFYISHQIIITTKRITYELTDLEKRLEIVKGLVLALENVTKVISIIRSAEDRISAKVALIVAFNFTENQAEAIVQLRLYRLSATDVTNLKLEQIDINAKIKMKKQILADEKLLREVIIEKLIAMKENYALPRKSEITGEIIEIKIDEKATMRQEEVFISVSHDGWIKVINNKLVSKNVNYQDFGRKPNDVIIATTIVNNFANLLLFTNKGNYFILPIFKLEEQRWKDNGLHVNTMCKIGNDEKIINMMEITNFEEISAKLILVTQQGWIKRILFSSLVKTKLTKIRRYTKLKEKDNVVNISICTDYDFIVVSTKKGFTLKYLASKVPLLSKTAFGVKALKMENTDEIVGMATGNNNDIYGILTTAGTLKRLLFNNIEQTVRTIKGNKILKAVKSTNIKIIKTFLCSDDVLINVLTNKEKWIVITAKEVPLTRVKEGIGKAISEDIILAGTNLGLKLNNKHFTVLPLIIPNELLETN